MRIGIMAGASSGPDATLDALIELARDVERRGFSSLWMAQFFGMDALTALAVVARETERIELGPAVLPTYPRHPLAMAQQAITASVAAGGRFTLGIGLSHPVVIEALMGLDYAKPATHMREYLEVLTPLLRGEAVNFSGDRYRVNAELKIEGAQPVPLIIAALGPVMLDLAGRFADGTVTWMTGPATLANHIVPTIRTAAEKAGRPAPRIIAGLPFVVTDDAPKVREKLSRTLRMYATMPSYRAMFDREGVANPEDIAVLGNEAEVAAILDRLEESGVTDFNASVLTPDSEIKQRTFEFLEARAARAGSE
jgi:5,10-methylenetetrahydromethanopterin reductase